MKDAKQDTPRAEALCPICKSPTQAHWRPFCSQRCADVDLDRWMTGRYAIPSDEPPDQADDPA